jgi:hypothetical protein
MVVAAMSVAIAAVVFRIMFIAHPIVVMCLLVAQAVGWFKSS